MALRLRMILLSVFILAISGLLIAQQNTGSGVFSESRIYVPREIQDKKDKKAQNKKPEFAAAAKRGTVTIPVTVLSADGKLVTGLPSEAFEVEIDGRPVPIREVKKDDGPLDVVLLLDMSPSAGVKLDAMKQLARKVVSNFRPDDRITLARFNRSFKVVERSTTDRTRLEKAIKKMQWDDGTAIYDAFGELFDKALSEPYPHAVIVLTDGVDTVSDEYSYRSSLVAAERHETKIFAVYVDTYGMQPVITGATTATITTTPGTVGVPTPLPGLPPGAIIVPPGSLRQSAGMSAADYERGNQYLTDLVNLSGGRPIRADNVLAGRSIALDSIPYELVNQYYVVIDMPTPSSVDARHTLKVRVKGSGFVVNAKGSLVE